MAARVPISGNSGQWRYCRLDLRFVAGRSGKSEFQKMSCSGLVEPMPSQRSTNVRTSHPDIYMSKSIVAAVALLLVAGLPIAASATPQEDAYIAARDKYLKHFEKADFSNDAAQKEMDR